MWFENCLVCDFIVTFILPVVFCFCFVCLFISSYYYFQISMNVPAILVLMVVHVLMVSMVMCVSVLQDLLELTVK